MNTTYRCSIDFSLDIQADSEDEALAKMESLIGKAIKNLNADLCDLGFIEGGGVLNLSVQTNGPRRTNHEKNKYH